MITLIVFGICYSIGEFPARELIEFTVPVDVLLFILAGMSISAHVNK